MVGGIFQENWASFDDRIVKYEGDLVGLAADTTLTETRVRGFARLMAMIRVFPAMTVEPLAGLTRMIDERLAYADASVETGAFVSAIVTAGRRSVSANAHRSR